MLHHVNEKSEMKKRIFINCAVNVAPNSHISHYRTVLYRNGQSETKTNIVVNYFENRI